MGKKDGKKAERHVAKALSLWWTDDPQAIRRAPCSGGWLARGADGDIVSVKDSAKDFPWTVEVKDRKSWSLRHLFGVITEKSQVGQWWAKLRETCEKHTHLLPMLVITRPFDEYYVLLDRKGADLFLESVSISSVRPVLFTEMEKPVEEIIVFHLDRICALDDRVESIKDKLSNLECPTGTS